MNKDKGNPFLIVTAAVAAVAALSFVPWSDLTGGVIKDFNLISDILPSSTVKATANENIDPELIAAIGDQSKKTTEHNTSKTNTKKTSPKQAISSRVNGNVVFEDYSANGTGLSHIKRALMNVGSRVARIAVIGDSYIEGDILTMHIRQALQDLYGGAGVGYVPLASEVCGFRTSVREQSNGWTIHDMRKTGSKKYKTLSGEYFTADAGASTKFSGTKKLNHLNSWNSSKFLYIAPSDGTITITTDAEEQSFAVTASETVQCVEVPGATTMVNVSTDIAGLTALGMYINNTTGVVLDNMSMRGNSGVSHRYIDDQIAAQMRKYVDYDLIVLEYGINALSSQQTDYTAYGKIMQQVVSRIRLCYPNADILMLAVGDRGQKIGGEVQSLPTSQAMIDAQRNAAQAVGCVFWDTREAMGGINSVVSWRERGLINADYIHLNAKGGAALAQEFMKSFKLALQ
jgi:lysophospholipase L1-like esterase